MALTDGRQDVLLASAQGKSIRFKEDDVRSMGRVSRGVRGMTLEDDDKVIGMAILNDNLSESTLFTVTENGYGKRTEIGEYRCQTRGGKGVITIKTTERNGKVVNLRLVSDDDDLMLITDGGKLIRMPVDGIPTIGRNTQGVRLIRLEGEEKVVALERMAEKEEGEREVSPEVAAARAEQQAEPLAAEDLGDEAGADEGDGEDDDEEGGDDSGGEES